MAQSVNIYRVGDYVYVESYPSAPYLIRRIEELNKTANGTNVEAKLVCFYRRRDLPASLLKISDQAERQSEILCRPRRCLLARNSLASTSNGGDAAADEEGGSVKENGVSAAHKKATSAEPKEEETNNFNDASNNNDAAEAESGGGFAGLPLGAQKLPPEKVHALRQRELFLSRQVETLPATQIRSRCTVVMLSEVETCDTFLDRDDAFFYSLVYDPSNQTLLADKGKIEIGERHQAVVPDLETSCNGGSECESTAVNGNGASGDDNHEMGVDEEDEKMNGDLVIDEEDEKKSEKTSGERKDFLSSGNGIYVTPREQVVYHPHHNLTDCDIDQFLIVARAIGTFSRALDSSATIKLPSLHMTASAASRDVTLFHAMALLHQANYDIGHATKYLVPPPSKQQYPLDVDKVTGHNTVSLGGPVLCRDQLEEWSAAEATLFEDALEKYGKDFHDIRVDCLPWKSIRDIVEYYYMWKTTARYTEMQKNKLVEQEKHLKQIYIPTYTKANPNLIGPANAAQELLKNTTPIKSAKACESCKVSESTQWYTWGPAHLHMRLCNDCWAWWRKNGGLKSEHEYESYDIDGVTELTVQQQIQQQLSGGNLSTAARPTNAASNNVNNRNASTQQPRGQVTGVVLPQQRHVASAANNNTNNLLQVQQHHVASHPLVAAAAAAALNNIDAAAAAGGGAKSRVTFFLNTTLQARVARRMAPKSVLNMRKAARSPFRLIDGKSIQNYYYSRNITEVIRVARNVRHNRMPPYAVTYLTRLHSRHGIGAGGGNSNASTTPTAAAVAAAAAAAGLLGGNATRR